ncbi:MAG: hypothetical protein ACRC30_01325 [Clostridium sp.]
MKLYHISNNIQEIEVFRPRIPKYFDERETKIARISMSETLEGCIAGTLYTWFGNEELKKFKRIKFSDEIELTSKIAKTVEFQPYTEVRVYEFEVDIEESEYVVLPKNVFGKFNVFDAAVNREYWVINKEIKPIKTYILKLKSMKCLIKENFYKEKLMEYTHIYKLNTKEIKDLKKYIEEMDKHYSEKYMMENPKKCMYELENRKMGRDCKNIINKLVEEKLKFLEKAFIYQ